MRIFFDHSKGVFTESGDSLLEVYSVRENESVSFMFDNGWLPSKNIWYQTKSSRLNLENAFVSNRRKKELSKITIECSLNNEKLAKLIHRSYGHFKFDSNIIEDYINQKHLQFWMDDCFCAIVNLVEEIPYYTFMIWDKTYISHSYGILSFYYMIDFFKQTNKYLYISEYYEQFKYKEKLPGFEWWNGTKWNPTKVKKK
jgi:hypothetical protein